MNQFSNVVNLADFDENPVRVLLKRVCLRFF